MLSFGYLFNIEFVWSESVRLAVVASEDIPWRMCVGILTLKNLSVPSLLVIFIVLFVHVFLSSVDILRLVLYFVFSLFLFTRCSSCDLLILLLQLFSQFNTTHAPQVIGIKSASPQIELKIRLFRISAYYFEPFELWFIFLWQLMKWNSVQVLLFKR